MLEEVFGYITPSELAVLHRLAAEAPMGSKIVEIGTYRGKSTLALAMGARQSGAAIWTIDSHEPATIQNSVYGPDDNVAYFQHIAYYGVADIVRTINLRAEQVARGWEEQIDLLFIDGWHEYENVKRDFDLWSPFVKVGGRIAMHDTSGNWPGVTRLVNEVLESKTWKRIALVDSISVLVKQRDREAVPGKYGIRDGYMPRLFPEYFQDTMPDGKVWQPDIYNIAAHLARISSCSTLIDIGCGRGHKLLPFKDEFRIIGVDTGDNIAYCRTAYDWGDWLDCDLERNLPPINGKDADVAVVICADVIEHLADPSLLMATLEKLVERAPVVLVSTPDRARVYGYDQDGPPGNPHHVREWTLAEMADWMHGYDLRIGWAGWTRSNNVDPGKNTLLIAATRPQSSYTVNIDGVFDVEAWRE